MKLSTRSRYGARLLVEVASGNDCRVSMKKLASRSQISRVYAERLIAPLVAEGIITSYRGFGGGVCLSRPPGLIKLSEVVKILEGDSLLVKCVSSPEVCTRSDTCVMRIVWKRVEEAIFSTLDSITIQQLADISNAGDKQTNCLITARRKDALKRFGEKSKPGTRGYLKLSKISKQNRCRAKLRGCHD